MADNCYLFFNSQINVDLIKVDSNINQSFEDSVSQKEEMVSTTILFNTFNETVDALYFSPEDPVGGATIAIYKKTPTQQYYNFVTLLENGQYEFYDYNIVNHENYHYLASIEIQTNTIPEYLVYQNLNLDNTLEYLNINWNTWSLINIIQQEDGNYIVDGDMWTFRANIESENLTQNTNVISWDTLGQYPKFSIGQKNYNSSSFTALLGDIQQYRVYSFNYPFNYVEKYGYTEKINVNNQYATEMEKLKAWEIFVGDGETKLLRDLKGNGWIVQVLANPTKQIELNNNYQATTISFQWQEINSIKTVSIIGLGG